MKYLKFIIAGFLIVLIDFSIRTGLAYPEYQMSSAIGSEFQTYTINAFFGAHFRFDIFHDFIGYVLIILGLRGFKRSGFAFHIALFMAVIAAAMSLLNPMLPFVLNGEKLSYIGLLMAIVQLGFLLSTGYFLTAGICSMLEGYQYKRDRFAIALAWFATFVCQVIVFLTTWLDLELVTFIYNLVLFGSMLFFLYRIYKIHPDLQERMNLSEEK